MTVFGDRGRARTRSTPRATRSGTTIEGPATWRGASTTRQADVEGREAADAAALERAGRRSRRTRTRSSILRVDYFENYAGRFLSVEAKTRLGGVDADGRDLHRARRCRSRGTRGAGHADRLRARGSMSTEHRPGHDARHLHRAPRARPHRRASARRARRRRRGSASARAPARRVEATVNDWLGGGLPPMAAASCRTSRRATWTRPRSTRASDELAAEFPDLAELITLPNKTNGYQRRAQATMSGLTDSGQHAARGATGAVAGRRPHLARLGPRGRQRHHGRVREPGRRRTRR